MNYKVGDIVCIKSKEWYEQNKNNFGYITCDRLAFNSMMSCYCGEVGEITEIPNNKAYFIDSFDTGKLLWADGMIERLATREEAIKYLKSENIMLKSVINRKNEILNAISKVMESHYC